MMKQHVNVFLIPGGAKRDFFWRARRIGCRGVSVETLQGEDVTENVLSVVLSYGGAVAIVQNEDAAEDWPVLEVSGTWSKETITDA